MFVRWKRRLKQRVYSSDAENGYSFHPGWVKYAVLCKSERVNGKPRQKFIAHLGDIAEDNLQQESSLFNFWQQSRLILNWIRLYPERYGLSSSEMNADVLQKLVSQIEETVPAISKERMREIIIRKWGMNCRAARDDIEQVEFLDQYALEEGDGYMFPRTALHTELVNMLQSVVSK